MESVEITTPITCTDQGVYLLTYTKDTRPCSTVVPTYAGECGDHSSIMRRYASHMATATQPIQEEDTVKPAGIYGWLPQWFSNVTDRENQE